MAAWSGWEKAVLAAGGWPTTQANVDFLATWHTYEGSACQNNPLNTTLRLPGSTTCNAVGVQSYSTHAQGTAGTVETLQNGFYPSVVAALTSGDPFSYTNPDGVAANVRTWGTPNFAAWYLEHAGSFGGTGVTVLPTPAPSTAVAVAPHMHHGWADLRNSVNKHLPRQLERSRQSTAVALRRLAHGRKVGG